MAVLDSSRRDSKAIDRNAKDHEEIQIDGGVMRL